LHHRTGLRKKSKRCNSKLTFICRKTYLGNLYDGIFLPTFEYIF
jgi:hypothetical protein